jgi:diguanylate cyclase (GGDEF)-like protein
MQTAERLRQTLAEVAVPTGHAPEPLRVTVSVGVAALSDGESLDELLARADKSLYEAKRAGRNRVVGPRAAANPDKPRHTPVPASAAA